MTRSVTNSSCRDYACLCPVYYYSQFYIKSSSDAFLQGPAHGSRDQPPFVQDLADALGVSSSALQEPHTQHAYGHLNSDSAMNGFARVLPGSGPSVPMQLREPAIDVAAGCAAGPQNLSGTLAGPRFSGVQAAIVSSRRFNSGTFTDDCPRVQVPKTFSEDCAPHEKRSQGLHEPSVQPLPPASAAPSHPLMSNRVPHGCADTNAAEGIPTASGLGGDVRAQAIALLSRAAHNTGGTGTTLDAGTVQALQQLLQSQMGPDAPPALLENHSKIPEVTAPSSHQASTLVGVHTGDVQYTRM